jgi:hypothetical protein
MAPSVILDVEEVTAMPQVRVASGGLATDQSLLVASRTLATPAKLKVSYGD